MFMIQRRVRCLNEPGFAMITVIPLITCSVLSSFENVFSGFY
jgi:hypothetical protein